jgi:CheY-like chemotaxis protein
MGISACLTKPVRRGELRCAIAGSFTRGRPAAPLPLSSPEEVRGAVVAGDATGKMAILLAEDNIVNQRVALRILQKAGHSVEVVANGLEALKALDRTAFDLILMDVQMPEMGGLEATAAIREKEKDGRWHIPIIAMTAHAMSGDRERCLAAGMDDYISKPIRAASLLALIEQYHHSPSEYMGGSLLHK